MGRQWSFLALTNTEAGTRLGLFTSEYHQGFDGTQEIESVELDGNTAYLRVQVDSTGLCTYTYSLDGENYATIGTPVEAKSGVWIGAKVGLFNVNPNIAESEGYADFDWFRLTATVEQ